MQDHSPSFYCSSHSRVVADRIN